VQIAELQADAMLVEKDRGKWKRAKISAASATVRTHQRTISLVPNRSAPPTQRTISLVLNRSAPPLEDDLFSAQSLSTSHAENDLIRCQLLCSSHAEVGPISCPFTAVLHLQLGLIALLFPSCVGRTLLASLRMKLALVTIDARRMQQ
jgi:hypothetical protein